MPRGQKRTTNGGLHDGLPMAILDDQVAHKNNGTHENGDARGVTIEYPPYTVAVEIVGTDPLLFHRYDVQEVQAKADAPKGSKIKKTDNLESYVYRTKNGELCIPGLNFKASIVEAARFFQDPRSKRAMASTLFRAGIRCREDASFGVKNWDFLDTRRAVVNQSAVPRTRPGMNEGWKLTFKVRVTQPKYITEAWLHEVISTAGDAVGLGDYRPDFGCFRITSFKRIV